MKWFAAPSLGLALCLVSGAPALAHHCWHHEGHCHHQETCDCHHRTDCQGPCHHQRAVMGRATAAAQDFTSVSGVVSEVIYLPGAGPSQAGVELRVGTGAQATLVRLGPAGFLNKNKLAPKEGDRVSVRGFQVATPRGKVLVAVRLRRGQDTLRLRDANGRPLW